MAGPDASAGKPTLSMTSTLSQRDKPKIRLTADSSNHPSQQVPRFSSWACSTKCSTAIPISIRLYGTALILPPISARTFDRSRTTATRTGASLANWFMPKIPENAFCASRSFNRGCTTTINRQGWELQAEGARQAASRHLSRACRGTSLGEYRRQLERALTKSRNGMVFVQPRHARRACA